MPSNQIKPIRKIDIFKVFLRSFFLQAVWNYKSLISVGFEICLLPIVKRLYPDAQQSNEFLLRHLKFFNAHPYLASYALGVSIRVEEGIAKGSTQEGNKLDRVKELLVTTLGAKGDQLFWLTIRPFSLIMGVLGLLIFQSIFLKTCVLILVFVIYNIPHLYIRYIGLVEGYKFGLDVYKCLSNDRFKTLEKIYFYVGFTAFVTFISLIIWQFSNDDPFTILFFIGAIFYSWILYKINRNFYYTILFTVIFFLIFSFLFL